MNALDFTAVGLRIPSNCRQLFYILYYSWNEWVSLPHLFSELPRSAMLAITILDCAGAGQTNVIGGTTIALFGKNGLFRQVLFNTQNLPKILQNIYFM